MSDATGRTAAWRRYLRFWRRAPERDVDDELRFHIESAVEELVAGGMHRADARAAATARFGDLNRIQSTLYHLSQQRERRMQRTEWWDRLRQDVAYGVRQLRRSPGFTAVAVLTLALGIGTNAAVFSVIYSVLLQPLPFADAGRVLALSEHFKTSPMVVTAGNFAAWKREASSFDAFGVLRGQPPATLTGRGDPVNVTWTRASSGYWKAVSAPPVLGRYFTDAEDREGGPRVAVLSYGLWHDRFGGDTSILGKSITLNGNSLEVIGVRPPRTRTGLPISASGCRTLQRPRR